MAEPSARSADLARLDAIVAEHGGKATELVQILREAQEIEGWLPPATITFLAYRLRLPRARVEGVAGFYSFLHLKPAGRYRVLFSDSITDRMAGNHALLEQLCTNLWIERGKISEDGLVSVDTTSCTGMCDQGPAILVNGRAIPRMTPERIDRVAELIRGQVPLAEWPAELFAIVDNMYRRDILLDANLRPAMPSARRSRAGNASPSTPQRPLVARAHSDSSARSGRDARGDQATRTCAAAAAPALPPASSGRPAARAPGDMRYVVCNADEGEPGTFKDRVLLASHADLVFEGMTVCAYVIGARQGFLYLRGEYEYLLAPLREVLARRRAQGLLGSAIAGQPASISTSRSTSAPAPMSVARNPR